MSTGLRAIGVDIGVTNVKSVCVDERLVIVSEQTVSTEAMDSGWPARVKARLARLEQQYGQATAVGIAAPGLADPGGSHIAWMQGRLAEVEGVNWANLLQRERVPVLNDAQAALLGEAWRGAAAGKTNVIMLTLGTGVGGAAMVDGKLLKGHLGRAGHVGHICLDVDGEPDIVNTPGSLENAIGNYAIEKRTNGRFRSTLQLAEAHLGGDADATKVWMRMIRILACGIASLVNVLDPEIVIIGGGIARAGSALFGPLETEMQCVEWRPHGKRVVIVPAELGEYAGAYGAAWNAMNQENGA